MSGNRKGPPQGPPQGPTFGTSVARQVEGKEWAQENLADRMVVLGLCDETRAAIPAIAEQEASS